MKWHKSRPAYRQAYIEALSDLADLRYSLFFEVFSDSKKYIELTSYATAKAVLKKSGKDYKATVYVDGFRRKEIEVFTRGLRDLHIRTKKIRGVKRDENNAFIRLADALCGLVRDADEATPWARDALRQLQEKHIVVEL